MIEIETHERNVLRPLTRNELNNIFDETSIQVLDFFIKKSVFFQPEIQNGATPLSLQLPKEVVEQWIVQAIDATLVGSGNQPIDVVKGKEFGADIKMVSCKLDKQNQLTDQLSGETSIAQNFKDTGGRLDALFATQDYQEIVDGWKDILYKKLSKAKEGYAVKNLYYIFILRAESNMYVCAFEINLENIAYLAIDKTNSLNIHLSHFIDSRYGVSKIYKSKKRLELRLYSKHLIQEGLTIPLNLHFSPEPINLRHIIEEDTLLEYEHALFQSIFQPELFTQPECVC